MSTDPSAQDPIAVSVSPVAKDQPLHDDIRLLGTLLGDTVRVQEGQEVFDLVETIRQISVRLYREDDAQARSDLSKLLESIEPDQSVEVIRAFSYFSHLANMAEDEHHIRRSRAHQLAGTAPRPGSLSRALKRAQDAGHAPQKIVDFFETAHVSPVLTAHPTEVRRRSTMRREIQMADLLDRLDRGNLTDDERDEVLAKLGRAILGLWHTNLLRQNKLTVQDEVTNGLTYYDYTFFRQLPALYAELEDKLTALVHGDDATPQAGSGPSGANAAPVTLPSFLRIGSWIGGDRDGNPFVTAEVLSDTLRMHSEKALAFHAEQLERLEGELSLSSLLIGVPPALQDLANKAGTTDPHRAVEPYRLALSGMRQRLAATPAGLDGTASKQGASEGLGAYHHPSELAADLSVIHDALVETGAGGLTRGRLRHVRRAIDCFGFHLASLDLRQNASVHEKTIAELIAAVDPECDYAALDEPARVARLSEELAGKRPLVRPHLAYSDETERELGILRTAKAAHDRFGRHVIPNAIISNAASVSDLLELAVLLKEAGLVTAEGGSAVNIVPLFETIEDLRNCIEIIDAALGLPAYRALVDAREGVQE
ncbi:MAG: phosphoenolpyruvate carboxylase, partial [Pseudomonadota bacterium]